ncbi:MAG: hypothetical protein DRO67_02780, partial [Candidatus Asgardarchaeum californiense]
IFHMSIPFNNLLTPSDLILEVWSSLLVDIDIMKDVDFGTNEFHYFNNINQIELNPKGVGTLIDNIWVGYAGSTLETPAGWVAQKLDPFVSDYPGSLNVLQAMKQEDPTFNYYVFGRSEGVRELFLRDDLKKVMYPENDFWCEEPFVNWDFGTESISSDPNFYTTGLNSLSWDVNFNEIPTISLEFSSPIDISDYQFLFIDISSDALLNEWFYGPPQLILQDVNLDTLTYSLTFKGINCWNELKFDLKKKENASSFDFSSLKSIKIKMTPSSVISRTKVYLDNLHFEVENNDDYLWKIEGLVTYLLDAYQLGKEGCYSKATLESWDYFGNGILEIKAKWSPDADFMIGFKGNNPTNGGAYFEYNGTEDAWWNEDYHKRMKIIITDIKNSLDNFPVYLEIERKDGMAHDYRDLRFVKDGLILPHEFSIITENKACVWVLIPTLEPPEVELYLYFNNPLSNPSSSSINTWKENDILMWHCDNYEKSVFSKYILEESGDGLIETATWDNEHNIMGDLSWNNFSQTKGIIGNAVEINGESNLLYNFYTSESAITQECTYTEYTLSLYFKLNNISISDYFTKVELVDSYWKGIHLVIEKTMDYGLSLLGYVKLTKGEPDDEKIYLITPITHIENWIGQWKNLVLSWSDVYGLKFFIDGQLVESKPSNYGLGYGIQMGQFETGQIQQPHVPGDLWFFKDKLATCEISGAIDEVMQMPKIRTNYWISRYYNQSISWERYIVLGNVEQKEEKELYYCMLSENFKKYDPNSPYYSVEEGLINHPIMIGLDSYSDYYDFYSYDEMTMNGIAINQEDYLKPPLGSLITKAVKIPVDLTWWDGVSDFKINFRYRITSNEDGQANLILGFEESDDDPQSIPHTNPSSDFFGNYYTSCSSRDSNWINVNYDLLATDFAAYRHKSINLIIGYQEGYENYRRIYIDQLAIYSNIENTNQCSTFAFKTPTSSFRAQNLNYNKSISKINSFINAFFEINFNSKNKSELSNWWDEHWAYRTRLTINNPNPTLTNYQIKLHLTGSLFQNIYGQGDDIRFTNADGTIEYSYWIEEFNTGSNPYCDVWVKIDSLSQGANDIYVYYGNPGAQSKTSGKDTFIFFEDFSGNSLDRNLWDVTEYSAHSHFYEVSDGELHIYAKSEESASGYLFTTHNPLSLDNFHLHVESRFSNLDNYRGGGFFDGVLIKDEDNAGELSGFTMRLRGDFRNSYNYYDDGTNTYVNYYPDDTTGKTVFDYKVLNTNNVFLMTIDDSTTIINYPSLTDFCSPLSINLYAYIDKWGTSSSNNVEMDTYYDIIYLRSLTNLEPTITYGEESNIIINKDTWWNTDWFYRRRIYVDGSGGGDCIQHKLVLVPSLKSKCQENGADLRFVSRQMPGKLLDYWIEDWSKGIVWVEQDYLPASGDRSFWMYYGNNKAAPQSNGQDTFPAFEDFNSASSFDSRWEVSRDANDGPIRIRNFDNGVMHIHLEDDYYYTNSYDSIGWQWDYIKEFDLSNFVAHLDYRFENFDYYRGFGHWGIRLYDKNNVFMGYTMYDYGDYQLGSYECWDGSLASENEIDSTFGSIAFDYRVSTAITWDIGIDFNWTTEDRRRTGIASNFNTYNGFKVRLYSIFAAQSNGDGQISLDSYFDTFYLRKTIGKDKPIRIGAERPQFLLDTDDIWLTNIGHTSFTVNWNPVSDCYDGYIVYINNQPYYLLNGPYQTTSVDIGDLEVDTEYNITIVTVLDFKSGPPATWLESNGYTEFHRTLNDFDVPLINISTLNDTALHVDWGEIINADFYNVYLETNSIPGLQLSGTNIDSFICSTTNLFYDLTGLNSNTNYTIYIRAVGYEVIGVPYEGPEGFGFGVTYFEAPQNLECQEYNENWIKIGWEAVSSASYYEVFVNNTLNLTVQNNWCYINGLIQDSVYTISVRAISDSNLGVYSILKVSTYNISNTINYSFEKLEPYLVLIKLNRVDLSLDQPILNY